jgi:RHS repeat-associated protein
METTAKGETAYTYDPANRLTSVNGQAVQWDDNGNMLADGQAVYTYNTANKLVGVTKGTSSIVYAYSGLGDRLRQIADGVTTDYTLDINAGLTQVLQDNTNKYVYGNPSAGSGQASRIAQIAETQTGYFLPDALGSMRQMTDPSADLTLARAYDPYGNIVSSSGAGETVYGYTGEMQSGGLVHLRARDYASQLGRFTSRDTWEGDEKLPNSFNKWSYGYSNPFKYVDPTGNQPGPEEMCSLLAVDCSVLHFYGLIPDYEGLGFVQYYKTAFDFWEPYITSNGLHKTTVAAAIAVQSEWHDFAFDSVKNFAYEKKRNGCKNWILDLILSGSPAVGFAKVSPNIEDENGELLYKDINLNSMFGSIIAMTDKIKKVENECGDYCTLQDRVIIAGMAQNTWSISDMNDVKTSAITVNNRIDWPKYFETQEYLSKRHPLNPTNYINDLRTLGQRNYNSRFQLKLFTQNLNVLVDWGWNLPTGINVSDLDSIMDLAISNN